MLEPLPEKVLVKPIDDEDVVNGIIISVKKQTKHITGEVIAVGSECPNVLVGDTVVFSKLGTVKFEEYLIIDYENILGTLKENK